MNSSLFIFTLLAIFISFANAARILAINPLVYYSHYKYYRPLWKELAKRGHEVVLFTMFPLEENIPNLIHKDISFATKTLPSVQVNFTPTVDLTVKNHVDVMMPIHEAQLASGPLHELIHNRSEHFDVVMAEIYAHNMFSLKKRFNAPLIIQSPMYLPNQWVEITGSPVHPLLYSYFQIIPNDPGIWERTRTIIGAFRDWWYTDWPWPKVDVIAKKYFGEDALTIEEVKEQVDLFLVNTNHVLYEMQPLVPGIVSLGPGMFFSDHQPDLAQDMKEFLDNSVEGVIYFSLGTVIDTRSMSWEILKEIINTFPLLPYKILWRTDDIPKDIQQAVNRSGNVITSKWVAQSQVLRHRNIKLFITQGGMQSLEEALIFKKPTIVIPFFADQHANAYRIETLHLGAHLDINSITTTLFYDTIKKVITDEHIPKELDKHSRLLLDQPMKPLKKAVWWVEYVIRNKGARHLHGRYLPWWQAVYADVIGLIFTIVSVLVYIIVNWLKRKLPKLKKN